MSETPSARAYQLATLTRLLAAAHGAARRLGLSMAATLLGLIAEADAEAETEHHRPRQ